MGEVTTLVPGKAVSRTGIPHAAAEDAGMGWPLRWYMEMRGWEVGEEYYRYKPINPDKPLGAQHRFSLTRGEANALIKKLISSDKLVTIPGVDRVLILREDLDKIYGEFLKGFRRKECR